MHARHLPGYKVLTKLPAERQLRYQRLIASVTGSTPLHALNHIQIPNANRIFLKLEYHNLGGVHHARIYPLVFALAEAKGYLVPGVTPVIEASAGGAAIAFTSCAIQLGFHIPDAPQVVVPSYLSKMREKKLRDLNAIVHKVKPGAGDDSTVHRLEEILKADKAQKGGRIGTNPRRLFCCTKTSRGAEEAYASLAEEACHQFSELMPGAHFDYFIGCIGSGSSISGVGRKIKQLYSNLKVLGVEHALTPVASSLKNGRKLVLEQYPHPFHGASHWGVDLDKLNIDYSVIDDFEYFNTGPPLKIQKMINTDRNLSVGLTTSAVVSVALRLASQMRNKNILIIAYDSDEQSQLE